MFLRGIFSLLLIGGVICGPCFAPYEEATDGRCFRIITGKAEENKHDCFVRFIEVNCIRRLERTRKKKDISSHVQDGISCNATTEYLAETSTDLHAATKGIYDQTLKFVS